MGSGKRRFRPDYGLRLLYDGFSPTVDLYFHNFRLYRLNVLGRGQYSTMVEMPYANKPHALSLDFNETQLDQILAKATSEVRFFIKSQLTTDPATPRAIDFNGEVSFAVRARLGQLQNVQQESFVPLIAQEILSDSNDTRVTQTANQPSMLSLAKQEIDQIAPVLSEFDPNADTTKIGSWGLLYLICGLAAGRSFHWTSTIPQLIPTGYEAFRQSPSGEPSEIQLAIEFRNLVSKWAQDPAGLAIARDRLADLERYRGKPLADNLRQYYLDCARLGIMLNSLSDLEIDDLTAIRRWASQHDRGWPILFYGAGVLLSVESAFPSRSLTYGVLGVSHSAKEKVKLLLDHYSHCDSWKSV
jgi:hypothetical protein